MSFLFENWVICRKNKDDLFIFILFAGKKKEKKTFLMILNIYLIKQHYVTGQA